MPLNKEKTMVKNKKAILVDLQLQVRVIITDDIDLESDDEFAQATEKVLKERIKEDPTYFINEHIVNYEDDIKNPFDPEHDAV